MEVKTVQNSENFNIEFRKLKVLDEFLGFMDYGAVFKKHILVIKER